MKILLDEDKKFYKANLHAHSTMSDGRKSPKELKDEYKKRGYSIIAFTDHEHLIDNSYLNDKDFLTITSCEIAIKEFKERSTLTDYQMKVCHLNFYALNPHNTLTPCYSSLADHFINEHNRELIKHKGEYEREYGAEGINKIIKTANDNGFLVSYNHPSWSNETALDYLNYDNLFAVEIYNTSCDIEGIVTDEAVFDQMLKAGKKIYCTACDDNHNRFDFSSPKNDSFGGWVNINANKLDYESIMTALKDGNFYSSCGPEIYSLAADKDKVIIKTSPCYKISLITSGRRGETELEESACLTQAEFTLKPSDKYFRIRVTDKNGKSAYTNAYEI